MLPSRGTSRQQSSESAVSCIEQPIQSPLQGLQFTLEERDASDSLLSHLAGLIRQATFQNLIHINNIAKVAWESIDLSKQQFKDYRQSRIIYQRENSERLGQYSCLTLVNETDGFQNPHDSATDQLSSNEEYIAFLDHLPEKAAEQGCITYHEGAPLDQRWNTYVNPGQELSLGLPIGIQGITNPSWYLGSKYSGAAFHKEPCNLRAMNLIIDGFKLWLIVDTQDTKRFEEWVRDL